MASTFDATIEKAVEDRVIPGVVLLARDKSGQGRLVSLSLSLSISRALLPCL